MADKNITYSVVMPFFNESRNLEKLYKRLKIVLDGLGEPYEMIFVDDGSTDGSYDLMKNTAIHDRTLKILRFNKNYGQHKAVTAGILASAGDYVITMDSDLQNPPEEIPKLIKKIKEGFDMVSGYRKSRKDSIFRRIPSFMINFVIFAITGLKMHDYGCMLRIFKRNTAESLAMEFKNSGGYITMLVAKITHNVAETEVSHDERHAGRSRYSFSRLSNLFFKILFCYNDNIRSILGIKTEDPLFIIERKIENGQESIFSY